MAEPEEDKQNLNGQMYLQTRTEKSVIPFICAFFTAHLRQKNYLGHSINAPTGRWQKNKDIHWYNRDVDASAAERAEEIRKVKEAEADALAVALYVRSWFLFPSLIKLYTRGFAPAPKAVAPPGSDASPSGSTTIKDKTSTTLEKEEKRRRKAERKEEKRAKKEKRRMERGEDGGRRAVEDDYSHRRRRDHSRSRSPLRRDVERSSTRGYDSRRPRSPLPLRDRERFNTEYYTRDHERERERGPPGWDTRSRRRPPGPAPGHSECC